MTDLIIVDEPLREPTRALFRPSPGLRSWLLIGAGMALLDGAVSASSLAAEVIQGERPGFTISMALGLAAIAPQLIIVATFFGLARETGIVGLRKGALGVFGCFWLVHLVLLSELDWPAAVRPIFLVAAGFGALLLLIYLLPDVPDTEKSRSDRAEDGPPSKSLIGGIVGGLAIFGLILLKGVAKFFGVQVFRLLNLDLEGVSILLLFLLLALLTASLVVFALAKIRQRESLGAVALVLGRFELLMLAAHLVLIVLFVGRMAWTVVAQPMLDEKAVDALAASWVTGLNVVSIGFTLAWAALMALLFSSIRSAGEPDWREDLADPPTIGSRES
ncbi:hypothetical protein BH23PLA1_BH23PLA1_19260 [soil metagenome]